MPTIVTTPLPTVMPLSLRWRSRQSGYSDGGLRRWMRGRQAQK
jgi:hypothetical protein